MKEGNAKTTLSPATNYGMTVCNLGGGKNLFSICHRTMNVRLSAREFLSHCTCRSVLLTDGKQTAAFLHCCIKFSGEQIHEPSHGVLCQVWAGAFAGWATSSVCPPLTYANLQQHTPSRIWDIAQWTGRQARVQGTAMLVLCPALKEFMRRDM